eukprot:m.237432 g.237432  ORF g.237432 m.237432 type:complete len:488 (-) comp13135_c0_seq1:190-1653(-)
MSTDSSIVFERVAVDENLAILLDQYAAEPETAGHGNYLPALDLLDELLDEDRYDDVRTVVFFISDGAPSDHIASECRHGVPVWEDDLSTGYVRYMRNGKRILQSCGPYAPQCRAATIAQVRVDCCERIRQLGDKSGDRLAFHTVGFGPAHEDFLVLDEMSKVLPKSTFQKLGLSARLLTSAFSSLTSTLTTMRTVGGSDHGLTRREARPRESAESLHERPMVIRARDDWAIYVDDYLSYKRVFRDRAYVDSPLAPRATGVAIMQYPFAGGAEREAYRCYEVGPDSRGRLVAIGPPLIAKQTLFEEELVNDRFHRRMAKVQSEVEELARLFNGRVQRARAGQDTAALEVHFVQCSIYQVYDAECYYGNGEFAWILAEPQLEGRFTKWNDNAGGKRAAGRAAVIDELPQVFSHFTWSATDGQQLVCDLQGVWNQYDGFQLTDPVVHDGRHGPRRTNRGYPGIRKFFETHRCTALCHELGLKKWDGWEYA